MFLNRLRFFHFWLHFLLHFGVILGAKFVTILLLVARVAKTGSQNTGKKTEEKKVIFRVLLGGWGGSDQLREERLPGMCLLTFGLKTELSLQRGAFSGFPEYLFR